MGPHSLVNWGAHSDDYPTAYFTVAAAIGQSSLTPTHYSLQSSYWTYCIVGVAVMWEWQ